MRQLLAVVMLTLTLAACGGGGGGGMSGNVSNPPPNPASTATPTTTNAQVSVDPSIPSSITSTVQSVLTANGSGSLTGTVPVDLTVTTGDALALAVNAQSQVVMATEVDSSTATFSADSTSLALVRMWIADGVANASMSATAINSAIRGTTGYPKLVADISKDLSTGTRPLSDAAVATDIIAVVTAVNATLPTAAYGRSEVRTANDRDLQPPPFTALPATIVPGVKNLKTGLSTPYLAIAAVDGKTIIVANHTPMQWTLNTEVVNEGAPDQPLSPDVTLRGAEDGGIASIGVESNNSPFNLNIFQQPADERATYDAVLAQGIVTAAGPLIDTVFEGCTADVLKGGVASAITPTLVSGASFQAVLGSVHVSAGTVTSILKSCSLAWAGGSVTAAILVTATLGGILEVAEAASFPQAGIDAILFIDELELVNSLFGMTYSKGVCAAWDYSIHSCVASFSFSPVSLLMAPGGSALVSISASDASKPPTPTVVPGDLEIISETPMVASLVANSSSFQVTALTLGTSNVSVTDPATGATNVPPAANANPFLVSVLQPKVSPSATNFVASSADQTLTVSVVGPEGEPACGMVPVGSCIVLPTDITWAPASATATETPVTTTGAVGTWTIPANAAPDSFTVTATGPNQTAYGSVKITVTPASLALDPANSFVTFTLLDLGPTGGSLISGPGSASSSCTAPCPGFSATAASFNQTVSLTDVWSTSAGGTQTNTSSFPVKASFVTGTNPAFAVAGTWTVVEGGFVGTLGGQFYITVTGSYVATATGSCSTSGEPVLSYGPLGSCTPPLDVSFSDAAGGSVGSTTGADGSLQFTLTPGSYTFGWYLTNSTYMGCCIDVPPSASTAALGLNVSFQAQ